MHSPCSLFAALGSARMSTRRSSRTHRQIQGSWCALGRGGKSPNCDQVLQDQGNTRRGSKGPPSGAGCSYAPENRDAVHVRRGAINHVPLKPCFSANVHVPCHGVDCLLSSVAGLLQTRCATQLHASAGLIQGSALRWGLEMPEPLMREVRRGPF